MKKKSLIGYTTKDWSMVYTFFNTVNVAFIIQKTRTEAQARYDDYSSGENIRKVKITVEEIE